MAYTTINKSSDFFNTLIWSGNGSTRSITNLGFKPDITWIKSRTSTHVHSLQSMPKPGTGAYLETNSTSQEQSASGRIASFDSDGFSLGTAAQVNGSGNNYVGWNWKAGNSAGSSNTDGSITSTVSVNTTAGCSVVWYQHEEFTERSGS